MFTFHASLDRLIDHYDASYSRSVEHCAVVVSVVHENPRGIVGYWVLDVPNRAANRADNFVVRKSEALQRVSSLFPDGRPVPGVIAGLVAIMHTHPDGSSVKPSGSDYAGVPPFTLGIVCNLGRRVFRWYDREGVMKQPRALAPHPSWMLPYVDTEAVPSHSPSLMAAAR